MSSYLINPFGNFPPPPVNFKSAWTEVGRTTLGAPDDNIVVSGLPNKEFYMFLINIIDSPDIQLNLRIGDTGAPDTGLNYSSRESTDGAVDVTHATTDKIILSVNSVISHEQFGFGYVQNLEGYEKLVSFKGIQNQDAIDANYFRSQVAGKWSQPSAKDPLNTLNLFNGGTGSFPAGSELVVLGWSRFDLGTAPNFWNLLGENTALGGETVLATPVFAKRKYLMVSYQYAPTTGASFNFQGRFGETTPISTANSYQNRTGGPNPDSGSFPNLAQLIQTTANSANYYNGLMLNRVGTEKLWLATTTADRIGAGPPELVRNMQWGKQKDLTLKAGQIDIVNMVQVAGTGVLDAGSKVSVWGNN